MKKRPVNLNLFTLQFPITAFVSIAHRVSGFVLFFAIPFMLWILQESLSSSARLSEIQSLFSHPGVKITAWIFLAALLYHLIAGIRHLLMDIHIADSKAMGRLTAILVWVFWTFCAIGLGVCLW